MLQYARNLGNTVSEGVKRVVACAFFYYTSSTYYPIPENAVNLNEIVPLSHLKADDNLTKQQQSEMLEWANEHGRCVRQRSVRQETTKFKAGTLPLNMYANDTWDVAEQMINLPVAEQAAGEVEEIAEPVEDVDEEYDTDSDTDSNVGPNVDAVNPDLEIRRELRFLRATSRSGRIIKANYRFLHNP